MFLFYHSLSIDGNLLCSTQTLFAGHSRGDGGMSHENDSSWWSREIFSTFGFFGVVAMSLKKCCKTKLLMTVLVISLTLKLVGVSYCVNVCIVLQWLLSYYQECDWFCAFEFYLKIAAFHIKLVRTSTLVQKKIRKTQTINTNVW